MEGSTDLYSLGSGTLTTIRYQAEILGPTVRPFDGAVGPGSPVLSHMHTSTLGPYKLLSYCNEISLKQTHLLYYFFHSSFHPRVR